MKKILCIITLLTICANLTIYAFTHKKYTFNTQSNISTFSIIVSSYNYAEFIPQTIESVLNQTYPYFELILVNDGSTDNTLEIMNNYALKDNRIKIINQTNQGLSIARNNAMQIAVGKYFWFVDADDYIAPNALEILNNKIIETEKPDIISFFVQPIDTLNNPLKQKPYNLLPYKIVNQKTIFSNELDASTIATYPVTSGKQIYKKAFIKKHNIKFIPKLIYEDNVFFLSTLFRNAKISSSPEIIYFKREHTQQITKNREKHIASLIKLPQLIYDEATKCNIDKEKKIFITHTYLSRIAYSNINKKHIPDLKVLINWIEKNNGQTDWYLPYELIKKKLEILKTTLNS